MEQRKSNAKKEAAPSNAIAVIKKRLQKAKQILEGIQKFNIKQWTSLKNSMQKQKYGKVFNSKKIRTSTSWTNL
jgi:hypothetical protein